MTMKAKYPGTCRTCGGAIRPGDTIDWEARTRQAFHLQCPPVTPRPAAPTQEAVPAAKAPAAIELSGGSGYGCQGWTVGQVVRSGARAMAQGQPEYLMVVTAGKTYHREEGMSFGVGDDRGYIYWATCRAATEAESAGLRERLAAKQRAEARKAELQAIAEEIRQAGERPECAAYPRGVVVEVEPRFRALVLADDGIWLTQYNGGDGDRWDLSNLPAHIGWRVPRDETLVARIEAAGA